MNTNHEFLPLSRRRFLKAAVGGGAMAVTSQFGLVRLASAQQEGKNRRTMIPLHDRVIIFSDDEEILRTIVCQILQEAGFKRVYGAATSDETISLAQELRPALIITDMIKHGEKRDGEEMARVIKANESLADVPILLFSGIPDDDAWDRDVFCAFLQKPAEPEELLAAVRSILLHGAMP